MRSSRTASLLVLLAAAACGNDLAPVAAPATTAPTEQPASPVEESPEPASPITWKTCSLETGGTDSKAECANVDVPLDWNAPDGKHVTLFVKRVLGTAKGKRQQLWLLQGGPGGAGDGLEQLARDILRDDDEVDVYLPDHRGTGRSAFLDCPETFEQSAGDLPSCAAEAEQIWGKGSLATFNTTTAARDVGYVIERTRESGQKVHVYGVSYGTYWAQRYLQLFPTQATAVTLDSVCQSGLCRLTKAAYWYDAIGKKYLGECAQDATCKARLGEDPVATVRKSIAVADAGTCAGLEGFSGDDLKKYYAYFITSVDLRVMIPALAYRAVRCNADDVGALSTFVSNVKKWASGAFSGFATKDLSSDVLLLNIALSELEQDPLPSSADVEELMKDSLFSDAKKAVEQLEMYSTWPRYERDQYVGKYPDTATPVLLMNGTLDPQTPQEIADEIAPHYTKPNQSYVVFQRAAHCVLSQSPMPFENGFYERPCGMIVWSGFLASPMAPVFTGCTTKIMGHRFAEDQSPLAQQMFDRMSLWGDTPVTGAPPAPPPMSSSFSIRIEDELRRGMRDTRMLHLGDRLRARARAH